MRKWIYRGLIVIFAAIFLVSGWLLLDYYRKDHQAQEAYGELSDMVSDARAEAQAAAPAVPEGEAAPEPMLVEVARVRSSAIS